MSDETRGLYRKYHVERLDDPIGKHADCPFFVLDIRHDQHARNALCAYANSCRVTFPHLATDLHKMLVAEALVECEDASLPKPAYDLILARDAALRRAEMAEADAAALHQAWAAMPMGGLSYVEREGLYYRSEWLLKVHPGAQLLAELEAARKVVEAARTHDWGNIDNALFAYDKVKEGNHGSH